MDKEELEVLNEFIDEVGISNGLIPPPEGYCKIHKESNSKNCVGCKYNVFCEAEISSKMNLLTATIEDNISFDIVRDVEQNMMLAAAGIEPIIDEPKE